MSKQVEKNKKVTVKTVEEKHDKLFCNHAANSVDKISTNRKLSKQIVKGKPHRKNNQATRSDQNIEVTEKCLMNKDSKDAEDGSRNLSLPGLCSALQLANEIKQLASLDIEKPNQNKISSEKNKIIKQKVSKKVTVPFTKQIFSNLADFHINDADIILGRSVKTKSEGYSTVCDDAFVLSNFYKPSFSTQFQVPIQKQKVCEEKVQFFYPIS